MPAVKTKSSATTIASLPPFPADIRTAPLCTVSLARLLSGDANERARVLEACRTRGFFYLNLTDTDEGIKLDQESVSLFDVAKGIFDLPLEEKKKYPQEMSGPLAGFFHHHACVWARVLTDDSYKPAGIVATLDKNKRPDTTEFFNVSKDHVQGISESRICPQIIKENTNLFKSFTSRAHSVGLTVLRCLAAQLGLSPNTFADFNDFTKMSGDHVRLTKKTPHPTDSNQIGLMAHTDFGSITILFNWLGGLQIKSKSPLNLNEWEYVKPLPSHAIINLGDAMVKFTSGELTSAKHRVVPAPGEQANIDRYSVVYFVRPADDTPLRAVYGSEVGKEEEVYTAKEWIGRRVKELQNGK